MDNNNFGNLPRDLQLKIFQKFDMDMRIHFGFINRLSVPQELQTKIKQCFNARIPYPDWLKGHPVWLDDRAALRIPISNGARYEISYCGDAWYMNNNVPTEPNGFVNALLYSRDHRNNGLGFPDVRGLPPDFLARHPESVLTRDWHLNPQIDIRICTQPGSAYFARPERHHHCDTGVTAG